MKRCSTVEHTLLALMLAVSASAATTTPTLVFNSSSVGITQSSTTATTQGSVTAVTNGLLIAYCPGVSAPNPTWSVTSTPKNTWVALPTVQQASASRGPSMQGQMFYAVSPVAGVTTATCKLSDGPYGFAMALLVSYEVVGGTGTVVLDASANGAVNSDAASVTTAKFTTSEAALVVACGGVPDVGTNNAAMFGVSAGVLRTPANPGLSFACSDAAFTTPQSNITASVSYSGSFSPWVATVAAFKLTNVSTPIVISPPDGMTNAYVTCMSVTGGLSLCPVSSLVVIGVSGNGPAGSVGPMGPQGPKGDNGQPASGNLSLTCTGPCISLSTGNAQQTDTVVPNVDGTYTLGTNPVLGNITHVADTVTGLELFPNSGYLRNGNVVTLVTPLAHALYVVWWVQ